MEWIGVGGAGERNRCRRMVGVIKWNGREWCEEELN